MMRICYIIHIISYHVLHCYTMQVVCWNKPLIVALQLYTVQSLSVCPTRATSLELYHSRHLNDVKGSSSSVTLEVPLPSLSP